MRISFFAIINSQAEKCPRSSYLVMASIAFSQVFCKMSSASAGFLRVLIKYPYNFGVISSQNLPSSSLSAFISLIFKRDHINIMRYKAKKLHLDGTDPDAGSFLLINLLKFDGE